MKLRLGITGYPLTYTRSPAIHRGFLRKAGRRGTYEVLPFDPAGGRRRFFGFLARLSAEGYRGINVTIPLKEWAYEYCIRHGGIEPGFAGKCARLVGAANTIAFSKGKARAANTDSGGLWDDLGAWLPRRILADLDVVVVGTGGSARGAVAGIAARCETARGVGRVTVWGRNRVKARKLAGLARRNRLRKNGAPAVLVLWCLPPVKAAVVTRIWNELSATLGQARVFVYDLNYGARASATAGLVPRSRRRTGSGMLRRQARASFEIWSADPRQG